MTDTWSDVLSDRRRSSLVGRGRRAQVSRSAKPTWQTLDHLPGTSRDPVRGPSGKKRPRGTCIAPGRLRRGSPGAAGFVDLETRASGSRTSRYVLDQRRQVADAEACLHGSAKREPGLRLITSESSGCRVLTAESSGSLRSVSAFSASTFSNSSSCKGCSQSCKLFVSACPWHVIRDHPCVVPAGILERRNQAEDLILTRRRQRPSRSATSSKPVRQARARPTRQNSLVLTDWWSAQSGPV
jgi:hypothetical protein